MATHEHESENLDRRYVNPYWEAFTASSNWKCIGCGSVIQRIDNAKTHMKRCPRYKECAEQRKTSQVVSNTSINTTLAQTTSPHYVIADWHSLQNSFESLTCPNCHNYVNANTETSKKNKLAFFFVVKCTACSFEFWEASSPPVKLPGRKTQPDIQVRLPASAQVVGLKYSQVSKFLNLFGLQPPSEHA